MCRRPQRNTNNNSLRRLFNLTGNNNSSDTPGNELSEEQLSALFVRANAFMDREGERSEEEVDSFLDSLSAAEQEVLESIVDECLEEEFGSVSNYENLMQELEDETREWEKYEDGAAQALSLLPLEEQKKILSAHQNDGTTNCFDEDKPAGMSTAQWLNDCLDRYEHDTNEWIANLEKDDGKEAEIDCDLAFIEGISERLSNASVIIPVRPVLAQEKVKLDTSMLGQLLEEKRLFEENNPEGDPQWKKEWKKRLDRAMDQINLQAKKEQHAVIPEPPAGAKVFANTETTRKELDRLIEEHRHVEKSKPEGDPQWKKDWLERVCLAMDQVNLQANRK